MNEKQAKRIRRALKAVTASPLAPLKPELGRAMGLAAPKALRRAMVVAAKAMVKKERVRTPPTPPTSLIPPT